MADNRKARGKEKLPSPDMLLPAELAEAVGKAKATCPDRPLPAELAQAGISPQAWALAQRVGGPGGLVPLIAIECGLHSGYAPCCVVFFATVWLPFWRARELKDHQHYLWALLSLGVNNVGYVLCPACALAGKAVGPKPCPDRCPHRLLDLPPAEFKKLARKVERLLSPKEVERAISTLE
jgi:hypothetical protein